MSDELRAGYQFDYHQAKPNRFARTATLIFASLVPGAGVAADDVKAPQPVRTVGKHSFHGGQVVVEVRDAKDDRHPFAVTFTSTFPAPGQMSLRQEPSKGLYKDSAWFVYPESVERLWVFNGKDELHFFGQRFTQDRPVSERGEGTWVVHTALPADAPAALRALLPEAFLGRKAGKKP